MAKIRKSATIAALAARVFDIVESPHNWPRFVPHVEEASQILRTDRRIGDAFRLTYRVMGMTFDETITVVVHERPPAYRMVVEGRMRGAQDWSFEPAGEQTRITVDVDYQLPGGLIGKAFDALLLKPVNERTLNRMFQNLRALVGQSEAPTQVLGAIEHEDGG